MTDTLADLRAGRLNGAQRLDLRGNLTALPPEVYQLADSLEVLDLSHNRLQDLPAELPRLHRLRVLFLSFNGLTQIPAVLRHCPQLTMIGLKGNQITTVPRNAFPLGTRWLILTDNAITSLPEDLGELRQLQKLMLAGNQLTALPESLASCTNLELVRLAANRLPALPPWLLRLPRLAWLAFGGNPGSPPAPPMPPLPAIPWSDLTLADPLGQGASGVIYRAQWHGPTVQGGADQTNGGQTVAVKLFKGEVTSDGYPADEMRACMAAAGHPHLVSVLGQVTAAPDGQQGLVFGFIPPNYTTLGGPPSLETCTRDTYPADAHFALPVAQTIARSAAAVAAHLHRRGVVHGDFYPHNTQTRTDGHSLIGDFGAAWFYPADPTLRAALERIEVRAFGCLLDDLVTRCTPMGDAEIQAYQQLEALRDRCLSPAIDERPRFEEIEASLDG